MMEPTTRPGEIQRIAELAGGDAYRMEVLLLLTSAKEAIRRHEQWQRDHDRLDTTRFNNIEGKLGGVVSGIADYRDTEAHYKDVESQARGMKKLIVGLVALIAGLGGCIIFLIEVARYMQRTP